ncbi:MAG: hypothetical protein LLF94_07900 [Chlamydiales bacterium]|nr:hypothetical protein [Chlamydiales bacterium]
MSIPRCTYGVLPILLESIENQVTEIDAQKENATNRMKAVAYLAATVGVLVLGAIDEVAHVALIALKTIPVFLNVTVIRLAGYSDSMPAALSGTDYIGHFKNIARTIFLQSNAIGTFFTFVPGVVSTAGREIGHFPVVVDQDPTVCEAN